MQMHGAILPGDARVELRAFTVPEPGHGQADAVYRRFDSGATGKVVLTWD